MQWWTWWGNLFFKILHEILGKHLLSALPNPQEQVSSRRSAPRAHEDHWLVDTDCPSLFRSPAFSGRTGFPGLFLCDNGLRDFPALQWHGSGQGGNVMVDDFLNGERGNPASAERRPPRRRAAAPQRSQALLCFMPTQLSFFLCSRSLYCRPYWAGVQHSSDSNHPA